MKKYWFVSYHLHRTDSFKNNADDNHAHNAILCGIHPLVWAAKRSVRDLYGIVTYVVFFAEIPENVALDKDVGGLINVER